MNQSLFRIGNVLQDSKGKIAVVEELSEEDGIKAFSGMITSLPLQRVSLTEDLMRRLDSDLWNFVGFGTRIIYQHLVLINLKLEYSQGQVYFYFKDEMIAAADYLDEVQNLFFALTKQELEWN